MMDALQQPAVLGVLRIPAGTPPGLSQSLLELALLEQGHGVFMTPGNLVGVQLDRRGRSLAGPRPGHRPMR